MLLLNVYQSTKYGLEQNQTSSLTQQEAFTYLKAAYGIQPDSLAIKLELGLCLWKVFDLKLDGYQYLNQVSGLITKEEANQLTEKEKFSALSELASLCLQLGKLDEAVFNCVSSVQKSPQELSGYINCAQLLT